MEDESGLELSLGLSFGGSSSKFKVKETPSDPKCSEGSASRLMGSNATISDDSFKNLFKSGSENQDPNGKQKSDLISHPQENFFTDLVKCSTSMTDCSNDARNTLVQPTRYREQLISSNRTIETEEDKSGSSKRKLTFEEIKKGAKKSSGAPSLRNSHLSNNTEDGSTGENEDVAESEAEGPQSWLVLNKESNVNYGKPTFGIPLSLQPLKVMSVPFPVTAAAPSTGGGPNAAGFPSTCAMPLLPVANTKSTQLAFGYPAAQLPTLETGSSWAFNSQPLHISSFTSREQSTGVQIQDQFEEASQGAAPHDKAAAFSYDGRTSELVITSTRYVEDQAKPRNNTMQANEAMNKPATEALSREAPAIRPGVAPNLRFGGCGSYPELPWVTTTGKGPNGRTISGVPYNYNQNQIKIVCACHGTHMSPEEFVQHASSEAAPNSENNTNLASFTTANTTNSAQS